MAEVFGFILLGLFINTIASLITMAIFSSASREKTKNGQVFLASFFLTPLFGFMVALLNVLSYEKKEPTHVAVRKKKTA